MYKLIKKTKILIVEDEAIVALDIKKSLEKIGFKITDTVTSYTSSLISIKENEPDIIIMDIHLNKSKDGIETALEIKKVKDIPIIYLTAFSDDETIKRAIETDPLAYLLKPFRRDEIKSTIFLGLHKLNLINTQTTKNNNKHLGDNFYYDEINLKLFYKDIPIKLSIKENQLLKILIDANGTLITFTELEYKIWPDSTVSNSTLRTLIYRLRTKLEYKLIETVTSFGCKLTQTN